MSVLKTSSTLMRARALYCNVRNIYIKCVTILS